MNYEKLDMLCCICCNPVGNPLDDDTAMWINNEEEQRVMRAHKTCWLTEDNDDEL